MAKVEVDFFKERVLLRATAATQEGLIALALRVEERAKIKIVQNDQVDTGAMLNGIYAAWLGSSNYESAASVALSKTVTGEVVNEVAPPATDQPWALVAGAMEYTIWQEYQRPFLYPAFVATAKEAKQVIERVARPFFEG